MAFTTSVPTSDPPDPKKKPVGTGTEVVDQRLPPSNVKFHTDKFFISFSCSVRQEIGSYVTFVPSPGQTYVIMPSNKFYVTIGSFYVRDIVKKPLQTSSDTALVDFDQLATENVSLVHDAYNNLSIQATPPLSRSVAMMMSAPSWEVKECWHWISTNSDG
ncbi:hypothetical protein FPSE_09599 [Fusarium pseudograminearum CS3096]|uniref:Uncharacterized protein n=1 Tax=Fusarium pseudograminearum (strain CS3096) TaxID=1028729 RepID=K3VY88_FUSPC|nr:hypothetical protein FPSE_09599 [Fusarium pseudograminearum CS3096]EKJ70225.1 hypothetical protein FPSE_09599 [Fusarium pseudograminearum CS3096]